MRWTISTATMPHVIGHIDGPLTFEIDATTQEARERLQRTIVHITPLGDTATATSERGDIITCRYIGDGRVSFA